MLIFQLDECADNKKLKKRCHLEGLAGIKGFPKDMANKAVKDPSVLKLLLPLGNPLVTTDGKLCWEHTRNVPDSHPGIIAIRPDGHPTARQSDIERVIDKFKRRLPQWHELVISDCVIELCDECVNCIGIKSGAVISEQRIEYADEGMPSKFLDAINKIQSAATHPVSAEPIPPNAV